MEIAGELNFADSILPFAFDESDYAGSSELVQGFLSPSFSVPAFSHVVVGELGGGLVLTQDPFSADLGNTGGVDFELELRPIFESLTFTVIPEPPTALLLGFGLAGIALMRRHGKTMRCTHLALATFITSTGSAFGVSIPVANGGFENPPVADGSQVIDVGAPWTRTAAAFNLPLTQNPAGAGVGVADGEQRLELRSGPLGESRSIRQTLSATFQADTVYVFAITPLATSGVPRLSLTLGGIVSRNFNSADIGASLGNELSVSTAILMGDPAIGQTIGISVGVFGPQPSSPFGAVALDRARVWAVPIPEPSTSLLLALGLAGVAVLRRRSAGLPRLAVWWPPVRSRGGAKARSDRSFVGAKTMGENNDGFSMQAHREELAKRDARRARWRARFTFAGLRRRLRPYRGPLITIYLAGFLQTLGVGNRLFLASGDAKFVLEMVPFALLDGLVFPIRFVGSFLYSPRQALRVYAEHPLGIFLLLGGASPAVMRPRYERC
jgi:hypothetical protein